MGNPTHLVRSVDFSPKERLNHYPIEGAFVVLRIRSAKHVYPGIPYSHDQLHD